MRTWLMFTLIFTSGCSTERGTAVDPGTPEDAGIPCTSSAQCNDSIACTVDSCGASGYCQWESVDALCASDEVCDRVDGCVSADRCNENADCNDEIACTLDSCIVGNVCDHMPLDALCTEPGSTCNPTTGCEAGEYCNSNAECDDSVDCTIDICAVDHSCAHTPENALCEAGAVCTATGCFEMESCTSDEECDDGDFCNGRETCQLEFGCQPPEAPRSCADTDDCTADSCSTELNMCVFACDSSRPECGCPVETPCAGTFTISPSPAQTCACLGACHVNYNVMRVTFSCVGSVLSVNAGVPALSTSTNLTQSPRSSDGTFDVEAVIAGGCEERYRLTGAFTDEDHFTATFTANYIEGDGSCSISGCSAQSISVTGTRIP